MDVFKNTKYNKWAVNHVTDHNREVICTFRFIYIVMISSKDIANKCYIMIVKEC